MNKRQRKKAGLPVRPSRGSRRVWAKYLRYVEAILNHETDLAIAQLTLGEIRNGFLSKIDRAAKNVMRDIIPAINPWGNQRKPHVITLNKELPGIIHPVRLNVMVGI